MDGLTNKGRFIVLEGIDGSGKTTQVHRLRENLALHDVPCIETQEPSGGPVGSLIRQILSGRVRADNRVAACLFAADRLDHLLNDTDGILAELQIGVTVVSDRYYFSSYAYHSVDVDMDWVIQTNSLSAGILRPDLTVFLDVPVKTALERIRCGRRHVELYEEDTRLTAVRDNVFRAFEKLGAVEKIAVVPADGPIDAVSDRVWEAVVKNGQGRSFSL